jgi:uracil-DNA glycosylase
MEKINPVIEDSWKDVLENDFCSEYFLNLKNFLKEEKKQYIIYPPGNLIFNSYNSTPFNDAKVVIIGQDPYHGKGQAHGLCFSVQDGINHPPSLNNIFKELHTDLGFKIPKSGNLEKWTKQGVFLLNAILTVREAQAGSHQNKGWEIFTNSSIKALSDKRENLVFLLWGKYAQQKESLIDTNKHKILKCGHPSPMSANQGLWFGNKHFSKTNEFLKSCNIAEIDWSLE